MFAAKQLWQQQQQASTPAAQQTSIMFKRKSRRRSRKRSVGGGGDGTHSPGSSVASVGSLTPRSCLKRPFRIGEEAASFGSSSKRQPFNVRFQEVRIREFERIIGDNPSCSSGAPIGLGWKHVDNQSISLDEFEMEKQHRQIRTAASLVLNRMDREQLLVEWGASFNEIIEAIRANVKAKHQRRRTVNAIGTYDRWEEVMETARSRIKRTLLLKPKDPWESSSVPQQPPQPPSRDRGEFGSERSEGQDSSITSAPEMVTIRTAEDRPPQPRSRSSSLGDMAETASAAAASMTNALVEKSNAINDAPPRLPSNRRGSGGDESSVLSYSTFPSDGGSESTVQSEMIIEIGPAFVPLQNDKVQSDGNSFASDFDIPIADDSSEIPSAGPSGAVVEVEKRTKDDTPDKSQDEEAKESMIDSPRSTAAYFVKCENDVSVQTALSNLTSVPGSRASSADGNFESLTRLSGIGSAYWELQPGTHDSPQIRPKVTPVIISEDGLDDSSVYPVHPTQQQHLLQGTTPQQQVYYQPLQLVGSQIHDNLVADQYGFLNATAYNVVNGNYCHGFDNEHYGRSGWENGFTMAPPPNSTMLISKWE